MENQGKQAQIIALLLLLLSLAVVILSLWMQIGTHDLFLSIETPWMLTGIIILTDSILLLAKKKDKFSRFEAGTWISIGLWGVFMYYLDIISFRWHPLLPLIPLLCVGIVAIGIFYLVTYRHDEPIIKSERTTDSIQHLSS